MKQLIPLSELAEAATMKRSSLYVWMLTNHEAFRAVVAEAVRPDWTKLAKAFGARGLTDGDDNPPSAEGTRQTWWKVRRVVEARKIAASKRAAKAAPTRSLGGLPRPGQSSVTILTPTDIERDDEFEFHDLKGKPL